MGETTAVFAQKQAAMRAHHGQLAYAQYEHRLGGLAAYRRVQHLRGRGYGEAFRCVLPPALVEPS